MHIYKKFINMEQLHLRGDWDPETQYFLPPLL